MKVILLKNVQNLGEKDEIKEVKDGFARNFLIKKGLAKAATDKDVLAVEKRKEENIKKTNKEKEREKEMAQKMNGLEVELKMKTGKKKELFESVTSRKIAEEVVKKGFNIEKENVLLEEPIKALGEYPVKISFKHGERIEIKLKVVEEN